MDGIKEVDNKPEIPAGQTIRLPDRPVSPRKKGELPEELETVIYLALKYPQYTIQQLYEEVPAKWFPYMVRVAKKEQAEQLILLNNIINGPNAKDKSKRAYKKTIEALSDMLK